MGLERIWIGNWAKRGDSDCLEADYSPVKPYINTSLLKVGFHGDHGRGRGCGEDARLLEQRDAFQDQRKNNGHTDSCIVNVTVPPNDSIKDPLTLVAENQPKLRSEGPGEVTL